MRYEAGTAHARGVGSSLATEQFLAAMSRSLNCNEDQLFLVPSQASQSPIAGIGS